MTRRAREIERRYGVFRWNRDGRYDPQSAVAVYKSEKLAQKRADKGYPDLVVRSFRVEENPMSKPNYRTEEMATLEGRLRLGPHYPQSNEEAREYLNWLRDDAEEVYWEGYDENPAGTGKVIHKKLKPGTELAGWDKLSIWDGVVMAKIDTGGHYDTTDPNYFDVENVARLYRVYLSNVPADKRLLGRPFDQKYGHKTYWDQPFYYRYGSEWGVSQGQFERPFDYWVEMKFKDLGPMQTVAVKKALLDKGYAEASSRYILPASKWRKLLGMTYEETQDQPSKEANAVDDVVSSLAWNRGTNVSEEGYWADLPGLWAETKKGVIKFIISRNKKGSGL